MTIDRNAVRAWRTRRRLATPAAAHHALRALDADLAALLADTLADVEATLAAVRRAWVEG